MSDKANLEQSLSDYSKAVEELSKLLDFLPDDPVVRKNYIDTFADRFIKL
ncbi:MAG: hypothetical protein FWG10_06785 [Eubacteriaceae bacterium]|nr:hypothetical protein [Eubacteriaceae bacterium]